MKKALAVSAAAALLSFGVMTAASAGEITGSPTPQQTPIKVGNAAHEGPVAASECSFSGLEDNEGAGSTETPRLTQNWGGIAREARGAIRGQVSPATAGCNPTRPAPAE